MNNVDNKVFEKIAKLAVNVGINLQKGQEVTLTISTNADYLAPYIVEEAYKAGAKKVDINWYNDKTSRLSMEYCDLETLSTVENWKVEKAKHLSEVIPCKIYIEDSDPDAFNGLDVDKMTKSRIAQMKVLKPYHDLQENKDQWTILAVPSKSWAKKVFPNDDEETGMAKLWEAIVKTTRLDGDDPVGNWNKHVKNLSEKATKLNNLNLDYLKYSSSNGTDLTLKLQPNHFWLSAQETNLKGIPFVANMPTEEVFTMPKRDGANGVVVATKPLSLHGILVENFKVYFKDGKAYKVEAEKGLEVLEKTLDMDENSRYLGEVALVPYDSPINQTGLLFYNTLFDENACCHLAFGRAFANNIKGYEDMSQEDLEKVGFNDSMNHIDFMIGSNDLEIKGYDFEGKEYIIFKNGVWAL